MIRTFVDAGVLIAAARAQSDGHQAAIRVLYDPEREFVSSDFVRLEVEPKPTYHGLTAESQLYGAFFRRTRIWVPASPALVSSALQYARQHGLSALDALHIAAAVVSGSAEIVTTELESRPMFRVRAVRVVSIHPISPA